MVQSGKFGLMKINNVTPSDIKNWTARRSNDMKAYRSSNTNGETGRVPGNNDLTGTFEVYGVAGPISVGTSCTLALYTSSGAAPMTGPAVIGESEVMVNVETGDIIGFRVSWGCDFGSGTWTGV